MICVGGGMRVRQMRVMVVLGVSHHGAGLWSLSLGLTCCHQTVEVKFVGVPLAMHFGHDVLVVIVSEGKGSETNAIRKSL